MSMMTMTAFVHPGGSHAIEETNQWCLEFEKEDDNSEGEHEFQSRYGPWSEKRPKRPGPQTLQLTTQQDNI